MTHAEAAVREDSSFVRLVAAERLDADPREVAVLLAAERPWPGLRPVASPAPDLRRFGLDLKLQLGGDAASLTTFSKAAFLDLGLVVAVGAAVSVEIGWRAATAAPLFPVFSGRLSVGNGQMRIDGLYAPPGGLVGRVADRLLLHVAANGTARWLLREIDRAARRAR